MIARNEFIQEEYNNRRVWQAERYLYRALDHNPTLVVPGSLMDTFWTTNQSTTIRDYHDLTEAIAEYSTLPDALLAEWEEMASLFELLNDDADLALDDWINHPDSLELLDYVVDIYGEKDSLWQIFSDEYLDWYSSSVVDLTSRLNDIQSLSTPNVYATNEKLVMEATVKLSQGVDSISSAMKNSLITLAESCIVENGPAVFAASAILSHLDEEVISFDANCPQQGGNRVVNPNLASDHTLKLYPNPTSGELIIELEEITKGKVEIQVYNTLGQLVYTESPDDGASTYQLSLEVLPKGQYLLQLKIEEKLLTQSFIINR
jgi:hypothetical protein